MEPVGGHDGDDDGVDDDVEVRRLEAHEDEAPEEREVGGGEWERGVYSDSREDNGDGDED